MALSKKKVEPIQLTSKDLNSIRDFAQKNYMRLSPNSRTNGENFVARCWIKAVASHLELDIKIEEK